MTRKPTQAPAPGKRYQRVANTLIEEIRSGRRAVGDSLPGELDLVTHFDVSRHTVREALRRLEELGLIGRRQGVGTIVLSREPVESYVQAVRAPAGLLQYPQGSRLAAWSECDPGCSLHHCVSGSSGEVRPCWLAIEASL